MVLLSRSALAGLSILFTAGAILLQLLVVLAGTKDANPLNQIYFLRADTSGIRGAPKLAQWTLWNTCDASLNGLNDNCGKVKPAYPFDPQNNFGTDSGVPDAFVGTKKYYLLSRFMFAFLLIALFFAVATLFSSLLALCSRLGGGLAGLLASVALLFQGLTSALMTATYVMGRNIFKSQGTTTSIGTKAFAFMWASVFCLLLATVLFCMVLATGRDHTSRSSKPRRRKSARSQGSFLEKRTSYS